jgi:hypothetical protein
VYASRASTALARLAGGAVGARGETLQLGDLDHVRPVDAGLVLAVLLRPVEGTVGAADELVAVDLVERRGRDPGADRHRAGRREVGVGDPVHDRLRRDPCAVLVPAGEEDGELVAAQPERLAALAQVRGQLREHLVAARVAVAVVDPLEVVDVDQAEAERVALRLRVGELALEPVVEVTMVAEPGERVGEREPHRAELAEGGALVERDREQRADEGGREERRALPEHDEHERRRGHQRERQPRDLDARPHRRQERLPRADADDEADQEQVDPEVHAGGDDHLGEHERRLVAPERRDRRPGDERRDREHRRVVDDADRRPVLEQLHDRRGEADDHAGLPAVEHDRGGAEDEAERDAAGVDPVQRDRVALGERRRGQKAGDARERREVASRDGEGDGGRCGDRESEEADRQDDRREPRGHLRPRAHRTVPTTSPR